MLRDDTGNLKLVIVVAVGTVLVAGMVFGALLLGGRLLGAREDTAEAEAPTSLVAAGEFITNLSDTGHRRFIQVEVQLELTGEAEEELERCQAPVRSSILATLRSKTYDEVEGEAGMAALAAELLTAVNGALPSGGVKALYFTQFIVQ